MKNAAGFQTESFEDWWQRIGQATFPTVPPDAAHHWIHEHWGGSPYGTLQAATYAFEQVSWPVMQIPDLLTRWDNFDSAHKQSRAKGAQMLKEHRDHPLVEYMSEHRTWPVRPIVLDNRDGHLPVDPENNLYELPSGFILIEGHTRFNIAIELYDRGKLAPMHEVWMMTVAPPRRT